MHMSELLVNLPKRWNYQPLTCDLSTGRRQTRTLTLQPVSSPLRRSSRIKQSKHSPGSESDSSSVSGISQTAWKPRSRTSTMDFTALDTVRKLRTRKSSISSDVEVDNDTPQTSGKRMTRRGSIAPVGTPTKVNTRATSKRHVRAVSEVMSPLRVTRSTRASSVDPESLFDQNKSRSDSPVNVRRQATMLPSSSLAKEQIPLKDRVPYVRLDATIVETDEITSMGNSDSSPDKASRLPQEIKKRQSMDKDKVEGDSHETLETSTDSSKSETQIKDIDRATVKNIENIAEEKDVFEKSSSSSTPVIIEDINSSLSSHPNSSKKNNINIEKNLSDIEKSLIDICKSPEVLKSSKGNISEILLDTSTEEQKSDKENEILNINNDVSVEKSMQPNVTSSINRFASSFLNKSLGEKETKSMKEELSERRHSSEITETAIKHDLLREVTNNPQEKMDISTESLSSTGTSKLQRYGKVGKVINKDETYIETIGTSFNEDTTKMASELDRNECTVIDNKNSNEIKSNNVNEITITQDEVMDKFDSIEEKQEQENLSKRVTKSTDSSNIILETNDSACDNSIDTVIQIAQSSNVMETSKKSAMDLSPEKTDANDILQEKIMKQNLEQESTNVLDVLETEQGSLQMKLSQNDKTNIECASDVPDVEGIDLFQDIPADDWREKNKVDPVQSSSQSVKQMESDNKAECELILVDKQAWLAAERMKAAKEAESFEYDSDDTVLLKSQLDAVKANYDVKKLDTVDEEPMDIDSEENEKQVKKRKIKTKRRIQTEIDEDSYSTGSTRYEDNYDDKSFNKSKTALNQTNDRSISELNKSEQSIRLRRSSKASDESDKEIEKDTSRLKSSLISKKDMSLRKSMERRPSFNKSSEDTQTIAANNSRIDDEEKELENTYVPMGKLHKKADLRKDSMRKSCNEDVNDDLTKFENKTVSTNDSKEVKNISLNRSIDQKSKPIDTKIIHLNDDESDNSDINTAMDLEAPHSMEANSGSQSSDQDELSVPNYLFAETNTDNAIDDSNSDSDDISDLLLFVNDVNDDSSSDTDDSNSDDSNSDINREYNLDGVEQKFSDDDDRFADECRISEEEFSDSDDNGSDLNDFIVNDNDIEDEEEEEAEDMQVMKETDESENEQNEEDDKAAHNEEVEDEEEQVHIGTESVINMEDENNEDNEDIQEKDRTANREEDRKENKFAGIETISPYASTSGKLSKMKRDIKLKKSKMEKTEKPILLESSNSDLSTKKKNKSLTKKGDILSDSFNLISSSIEKKKKSDLNLDSSKKLELDETFQKISKNEDIKSDSTPKIQNTSIQEEKSKDSTLNENINLKKLSHANREKMSYDFSPELLKLVETQRFSRLTPKTKSRKTMNINIESPTIKFLRKEKLNESAPTLNLNAEIGSLSTKREDTAQIKIKQNSSNNEVSDLVILCDNVKQKHSKKRQKKRKRGDTSRENITDDILSEDATQFVPKKKKPVKFTHLTIGDDNIREDAYQISEKKKKKKKQGTSKEDITDKTLLDATVEPVIPKKKKSTKLTQLTIIDDNIHEDACQISRKKKKKQNVLKENVDEILSENAKVKLKIPKKKKLGKLTQLTTMDDNICEAASTNEKKKEKKQDTLKANIIEEALFDDVELKISKGKKRAKHIQLSVVEDNTCEDMSPINCEDMYQINEKEKKKKKKRETPKETITEKSVSNDTVELMIPKKKKRVKLSQLVLEDNTYVNADMINETGKKRKRRETLEENIEKATSEDAKELHISKKKKRANHNQLTIVQDNSPEDTYQIKERETKIKKKQINVAEEDENVNKDNIPQKYICKNKQELVQQKKKHKTVSNLKVDSPTDKYVIKKKTKRQETVEVIETLQTGKKRNTLPVRIPVSKLKSDKDVSRKLLRENTMDARKSTNVAYTIKKLNKATTKVHTPKELEAKKKPSKRPVSGQLRNKPIFLPSPERCFTAGLKRLSNDMLENLTDAPTRAKKKRKVSRNEQQMSSVAMNEVTTADYDGCATQFSAVNLQNTKKQLSEGAAMAASFRQRMLDRNKREPNLTYIMYKMNSFKK
ncbi:PREDICTED: putative leucine-rich repeat-containing protein DDB_G0290503 [Vollenhovia emeryi]|uniref:putative leucine-rich repeat-containing protein DDB_G0290503 n=1 Tax=Vollenhovia emeryi TaxID=411798 RepID=UPI0005F432CD|nr:PREDICTED: putative leucine-rich repeat-containing protein DDB_G0290503 [Vollenhovia emeryi]